MDVLASDAVEYQGCYIWTPNQDEHPRPPKRRKTKNTDDASEGPSHPLTAPLLNGREAQHNVRLRSTLFDAIWQPQQDKIDHICNDATVETINKVTGYISNSSPRRFQESAIPSGLISTGPSSSVFPSIVSSVAARLRLEHRTTVVNIMPSQVSNLKAALKLINTAATNSDPDAEDDLQNNEQCGRRLNYDLQILCDYAQSQSIDSVILAFHDSEAFDGTFLEDLVEVISLWTDRIPFVTLFGVKTSVELFQDKLPRKIIRHLHGVEFDVAQISVETIFRAVCSNHSQSFWLGPGVSNLILQAQQDSIQGVASFTKSLQYAYMSHLFANPLSVLLGKSQSPEVFQKELYECIRNLDSFRRYTEEELHHNNFETAKLLLNDDEFLRDTVVTELKRGRELLESVVTAVNLLSFIQSCLNTKSSESWPAIYIKAMAGDLRDSAMIKDTLLTIRKLSSDSMSSLLDCLANSPLPNTSTLRDDLRKLESEKGTSDPLRSEHDTHHKSVRTTVVAHKVELSKHVSSLSEQDLSYSKLVNRVDSMLKDYFQQALINPQELFLHEVLVYDFKSPHREVFAPKPRYAIERALSSPRDYLGCSCCKGAQHGLSSTHPATSVLYQLYLESGALINISDLWSAFYTIIGSEDAEDEDAEQERALALFSRSLAELKYLGMIKNSRRKADHLAKLLWNGL